MTVPHFFKPRAMGAGIALVVTCLVPLCLLFPLVFLMAAGDLLERWVYRRLAGIADRHRRIDWWASR